MDQNNDYYYWVKDGTGTGTKDWSARKTEKTNADDIVDYDYLEDQSYSSSDDSPILNYKYNKYKRFAPYVPVSRTDIPLLGGRERDRERRWSFGVLAKFFLFCSAMILFCVLMYIPVYNKVNDEIPKGIVIGWSTHVNRDTKIYVQPNNVTLLHEPKDICNEKPLFLLIIVCSSTYNFEQRDAIRKTWANYQNYQKMSQIFNKVRENYKNYNYTYDLYPLSVKNNSKHKQKRSVGFGALLPHLAETFKAKIKTEKIANDDENFQNLFSNFDMNKDMDNYENYDYDTSVMKIPPKGDFDGENDMSNNIEKIMSILRNNMTDSTESDNNNDNEDEEERLFKLVFILGLPVEEKNDTSVQNKINDEIEKYGDIIQEGFLDSYNNLTLKSIMMLKWVVNHCQDSVRYILKTDDDMFINTPNLISTLKNKSMEFDKKKLGESEKEYLLIGDLIYGARPVSDSLNKWYSPKYMYSGRVYPRYLSGTGYALSIHAAKALYDAALRTAYFHLEDIYITGLCAARARPHIKAKDDPGFSYQVPPLLEPCAVYRHVTSHRVPLHSLDWLTRDLMQDHTVHVCERIRLTKIRRDRMKPKTTKKSTLKTVHH